MNETIKLILSLSLSGTILAIIIFALKPFIKNRLSKSIQFYIWIVILLRLVLPFSFEGSMMNNVFYSEHTSTSIRSQSIVIPKDDTNERATNSSISNVQENVARGIYNGDADHSRYFSDLFKQVALYLWLLGAVIVFAANLRGYVRFSLYLKQSNKLASDEQNRVLAALLNGRNNVRLVRNPYVTTPLLIGILRPCIIIPDINFNETQLKNILLHEIAHFKHFDIGVKWLTLVASSIHWFNPLMYFIKKEMNRACELACDEAVIKNLNEEEKQAYGDTLISIVAEHSYPMGVLQATMCEEKKSLKERLLAIMNHNKKSKLVIIISVILLGFAISGALYLGAGVGIAKDIPIDSNIDIGGYSLYIKSEGQGRPTVVFETATGETSAYWGLVADEVQKHTRTVTYDRAGLRKSEKSPYNRTSEQKAIELHALLKKAKIKPPYILVGSEFGVHNIRMFAAKYPKEVVGIIMVDPRSENLKEISMSLMPDLAEVQYDVFMRQQVEGNSKIRPDGSYEEFLTSHQQVKAHLDSIKNIPVIAIISGIGSKDSTTQAVVEDQRQMAALSSKSKVVEISSTAPYIAYSETKTIIREILEMLNQVKEK